jgi:hypothetical protein
MLVSLISVRLGSAERSLAGAGQAEEDRGVALGPTFAEQCIGIATGGQIVQRGEDRLLHLAGIDPPIGTILRAKSSRQRFRAHAVTFGIGAEARQIDDGEFSTKSRKR